MTAKERKSIAEQLHAVQDAIEAAQGQLDTLLDQVINVNEPKPKAPAKKSKTKAK